MAWAYRIWDDVWFDHGVQRLCPWADICKRWIYVSYDVAACCYGVCYDLARWGELRHQGITNRLYLTPPSLKCIARDTRQGSWVWMDGMVAAIFVIKATPPMFLWLFGVKPWFTNNFDAQDRPDHPLLYLQPKYSLHFAIFHSFRLATCRWKLSWSTVYVSIKGFPVIHCRTRFEDTAWLGKDLPIRQGKRIMENHRGIYLTLLWCSTMFWVLDLCLHAATLAHIMLYIEVTSGLGGILRKKGGSLTCSTCSETESHHNLQWWWPNRCSNTSRRAQHDVSCKVLSTTLPIRHSKGFHLKDHCGWLESRAAAGWIASTNERVRT